MSYFVAMLIAFIIIGMFGLWRTLLFGATAFGLFILYAATESGLAFNGYVVIAIIIGMWLAHISFVRHHV